MPTYVYRCPQGHETEKFESMTAPSVQQCPDCPPYRSTLCDTCKCTEHGDCCDCPPCSCPDYTMTRQIGAGSGFTFKGGPPTRKFHRRG